MRNIFKRLKIEKESTLDVSQELEQSISYAGMFLLLFGMSSALVYKCGIEDALKAFHSPNLLPLLFTKDFWIDFFDALTVRWSCCILAAAIFFWFVTYKSSAIKEIRIFRSLFDDHKVPSDWFELQAPRWIAIAPYLFFFVFFLMAWYVDVPRFVGAIVIALFVLDMGGNRAIQRNLKRYLTDENYEPEGPFKRMILERREAANWYWIELPQMERILVCAVIALGAWQISFSESFSIGPFNLGEKVGKATLGEHICYVLLTIVILGNELVMRFWRSKRSHRIASANRKERHLRMAMNRELDLVHKIPE